MERAQQILRFAMRMEKDAEQFYSYYADMAESEQVEKVFRQLAEIERSHYELLKEKYSDLIRQPPPLVISWVVDDNSAFKDPHILSENAFIIDPDNISKNSTELSAFKMAYMIEDDFSKFYAKASQKTTDNGLRKFLEFFAGWEKEHRDFFHGLYEKVLNHYWKDINDIIF